MQIHLGTLEDLPQCLFRGQITEFKSVPLWPNMRAVLPIKSRVEKHKMLIGV